MHKAFWGDHERYQDQLKATILQEQQKYGGRLGCMDGGWSSHKDLHIAWAHVEAMEKLILFVQEQFNEFLGHSAWTLEVWAQVLTPGHQVGDHHHGDALAVAVYFLDVGGGDTPLVIDNMRASYHPVEGEVVLFEGWMMHHVPPHEGDRARLSIAVNARPVPEELGEETDDELVHSDLLG